MDTIYRYSSLTKVLDMLVKGNNQTKNLILSIVLDIVIILYMLDKSFMTMYIIWMEPSTNPKKEQNGQQSIY